jgi:SAM-dependent methyltransferase
MSEKSDQELQNINTFSSTQALQEYTEMTDLFPIERQVLQEHFPAAPARILDLGCGAGRTTQHLVEMGYDVVAGDIVPEMVEQAMKKMPRTDIRVLDATKLDLPSESFDVVWFSFNGLDYIYPFSSRLAALKEIKRVLKPGGLFVYSSHNVMGRFMRWSFPLRYHLGFMYHSLRKPLLQNYWRESHPGDNWLNTYAGLPFQQVGTLKHLGFESVTVCSIHAQTPLKITFKDYWPHYVARKSIR